jgi:hypothetical protein
MSVGDIPAVGFYRKAVQDLLDKAAVVRRSSTAGAPLTEADLGDLRTQGTPEDVHGQQALYAALETAVREKFYDLVVSFIAAHPCQPARIEYRC